MNILYCFRMFNKGYWGRNVRVIISSTMTLTLTLVILTFFLGFYNFYHLVSSVASKAQIIQIATQGITVDLPKNIDWSKVGNLYITQESKWFLDSMYRAFTVMTLGVMALMTFRELTLSYHLTKMELEGRENEYYATYVINPSKSFISSLVVLQKLIFTGISVVLSIALVRFLIIPLLTQLIDYRLRVFFLFDLHNSYLTVLPIFFIALLGLLFTAHSADKLVEKFGR